MSLSSGSPTRRFLSPRLFLPVVGVAIALGAFATFRAFGDESNPPIDGEIIGVVVEVVPDDGFGVSAFTLAGRDGEVYEFVTTDESTDGEGGPLTAGHMRQDAALGLETLVHYRAEGDHLIAVTAGHPRGHSTPTAG